MVLILTGMLVPVISFLVFSSINMAGVMNEKIVESGRTTLEVYAGNVQKKMRNIETGMLENIAVNSDFAVFANPASSDLQLITASYNLQEENKALIRQNPEITSCIITSSAHGIDRAVWTADVSGYDKKRNILNAVKNMTEKDGFKAQNGWSSIRIDGIQYFCRTMGYRDTYEIVLIDPDRLIDDGDADTLFFAEDGHELTNTGFLTAQSIGIRDDEEHYITGKNRNYLLIRRKLEDTQAELIYLRKYEGFISNLAKKEMIIFYISVFSLILIPVSYELLKRTFFRPVDKLVRDMNAIKAGEMLPPDESYRETEFEQVNETFREMLAEIRQLKIDAYEKQLLAQKVELQYYQIQIRPHFYLNCLKNIYGMLENKETEETQRFIIYLSRHLRCMMRTDADIVSISEELENVTNYIHIQELSMKYPPVCSIEKEPSVPDWKIPAISILSFVENSVKYGSGLPQPLRIRIKISMLSDEEGKIIYIAISDNGNGYPEEQLKQLNHYTGTEQGGEHIGIYNVMQRFFLFYGKEQTGFAFSDLHPGARTEIFIRQKEEGSHEHTDG